MQQAKLEGDPWGGHGAPSGDHVILQILRYNGLFVQPDDLKWLLFGENHLSTYKNYPQGMFTTRTFSNNRYPTLRDSLAQGKTHGVYLWSYAKRECEKMELIIDAWMVDLILCYKMRETADRNSSNQYDGNKFQIFNPNSPKTQLFCRRLLIPR